MIYLTVDEFNSIPKCGFIASTGSVDMSGKIDYYSNYINGVYDNWYAKFPDHPDIRLYVERLHYAEKTKLLQEAIDL